MSRTTFVYFDLADTLIHKPALMPAIARTLETRGIAVDQRRIRAAHRHTSELLTLPQTTDRRFYRGFNARFLETLGQLPDPALGDRLYEAAAGLAWHPCRDLAALECLDRLAIGAGILSNWGPSLDADVARLLDRRFEPVIGSAATGLTKPDPRLYHLAVELCGHLAGDILMVGDSIHLDVAPALGVGMRAVLIDRDDLFPHFDGERITSLAELPALLERRR